MLFHRSIWSSSAKTVARAMAAIAGLAAGAALTSFPGASTPGTGAAAPRAANPIETRVEIPKLRMALNRPVDGTAIPYLEALTQGYFRASGVDVSISSEGSSDEALDALSRGIVDVAVADLNALIRLRADASRPALKAVFVVHNRSSHAIIARKSRGIASLQDLVGKKLGVSQDSESVLIWPALAELNQIEPGKVTVERISQPVREPMLSAGQIDAATGLSFRTPVDLKDRGIPASDLLVLQGADYGYPLYGDAVIVRPEVLDKNADAVRRLLVGLARGITIAATQPGPSVERTLRTADAQVRALELERWKSIVRDCIVSEETRRAGLGLAASDRLSRSIRLVLGAKPSRALKPDDIFDASFLPGAESLMLR